MTLHQILSSKSNKLFIILAGFFIANAIVAEFMGVKIFSLETTLGLNPLNLSLFGVTGLGLNLTAGVLLWPVIFVMTDILNEYYGQKRVRFISYLTVGLIFYGFIMIYWAISLSPNDWWQNLSGVNGSNPTQSIADMDLAYRKIMGQGLWIVIGSMIAFMFGQIIDVLVFHQIKKSTGEKKIWLRATGSTLVSQFIDSFIVLFIAFYIGSDWPLERVLAIGLVNYTYKFVVAILLTPVIYFIHEAIEIYLGKELATQMKKEAAEE